MSVKFILSNTFGFSADNMYRLIAKNVGNGRQIVIVPDKFSLAFERNILKKTRADLDVRRGRYVVYATCRESNAREKREVSDARRLGYAAEKGNRRGEKRPYRL